MIRRTLYEQGPDSQEPGLFDFQMNYKALSLVKGTRSGAMERIGNEMTTTIAALMTDGKSFSSMVVRRIAEFYLVFRINGG